MKTFVSDVLYTLQVSNDVLGQRVCGALNSKLYYYKRLMKY